MVSFCNPKLCNIKIFKASPVEFSLRIRFLKYVKEISVKIVLDLQSVFDLDTCSLHILLIINILLINIAC